MHLGRQLGISREANHFHFSFLLLFFFFFFTFLLYLFIPFRLFRQPLFKAFLQGWIDTSKVLCTTISFQSLMHRTVAALGKTY